MSQLVALLGALSGMVLLHMAHLARGFIFMWTFQHLPCRCLYLWGPKIALCAAKALCGWPKSSFEGVAGSWVNGNWYGVYNIYPSTPFMEICPIITANHPYKFNIWIECLEISDCFNCILRPPFALNVAGAYMRM